MIPLLVAFIVLLSSRCDSLRDRHFDPERLTRWRLPIPALGGVDLWHIVKWLSFYPPLIALCAFGYGLPWASWTAAAWWVGTTVAAWLAWRWGAPWKSAWIPLLLLAVPCWGDDIRPVDRGRTLIPTLTRIDTTSVLRLESKVENSGDIVELETEGRWIYLAVHRRMQGERYYFNYEKMTLDRHQAKALIKLLLQVISDDSVFVGKRKEP